MFCVPVRFVVRYSLFPTSNSNCDGSIEKSVGDVITVIVQYATIVAPLSSVHANVTVAGELFGVIRLAVTVTYCPSVLFNVRYVSLLTDHSNCEASAEAFEPIIPYRSSEAPTDIVVLAIFRLKVSPTVILTVIGS